jgi:ribosomal protein L37E
VNRTDAVMLLVFLVTFVIVPSAFFLMGRRRKHADEPNLQECPSCGAENYLTKERCFCCGYDLAAGRSAGPGEAILQRVKQADESRTKSRAATKSPQTVDE